MSDYNYVESINVHYNPGDFEGTLIAALRRAGKDPDKLTPDDLAPVDQFHTGGKEATLELAKLAQIQTGAQVLDVGGGIGGPARTLANSLNCQVTVLDLNEAFLQVGRKLSDITGLGQYINFKQGNALEMPFENQTFNVVWTQHATMNIADKKQLYTEIYRVLKPGGKLVFHDIMAGANSPIYFPVPWANDPSISFLSQPEDIRSLLLELGFKETIWLDTRISALSWFKERLTLMEKAGSKPPPLGLHLLLGSDIGKMFRNLLRNIEEERVNVMQGVFERP
jgi:ubiquinone/menaquinone biosynthesis C-methylase UbiE